MADLDAILSVLRGAGRLWHRTSLEGYRGIVASGAIEPNCGQFPYSYPQSKKSLGRSLNAVCLFDFDTASVGDIASFADAWSPFLVDQGAATIVIGIDSSKLDVDLLQRTDAGASLSLMRIPAVEIWYRGRVPRDAFVEYLVIRRLTGIVGEGFRIIPESARATGEVGSLASCWVNLEREEQQRRLAAGEHTLDECVLASYGEE